MTTEYNGYKIITNQFSDGFWRAKAIRLDGSAVLATKDLLFETDAIIECKDLLDIFIEQERIFAVTIKKK